MDGRLHRTAALRSVGVAGACEPFPTKGHKTACRMRCVRGLNNVSPSAVGAVFHGCLEVVSKAVHLSHLLNFFWKFESETIHLVH